MIHYHHIRLFPLLFSFLLLMACQSIPAGNKIEQHPLTSFSLLGKEAAQKAVTTDSKEGYFDKATVLEMSVQLKMESPSGERGEIVNAYKKLLQDDVEDFTPEERKQLSETFRKALDMCSKINPKLSLPEINLIKTKGQYYGASVYYTRDNCIVIPSAQLGASTLLRTLIHEIFHIYSRYNREKRDDLYAIIGYKKVKGVALSEFLEKRIIYNPDGVDIAYTIEVQDSSGRSFQAIPSIYSKFSSYRMMPLLSTFVFQLFEVVEQPDGIWKVANNDVGYTEDKLKGYWDKIGRNTRYTIHPDEVVADNFTMLAFAKTNGDAELSKLSPEGLALLKKIEAKLKE